MRKFSLPLSDHRIDQFEERTPGKVGVASTTASHAVFALPGQRVSEKLRTTQDKRRRHAITIPFDAFTEHLPQIVAANNNSCTVYFALCDFESGIGVARIAGLGK